MTRTRAASLQLGVRPRMVFRLFDRAEESQIQDTPRTVDDLVDIDTAAKRLKVELYARGAGWDSPRRTTDAGRLLMPADARRMLRQLRLLEQRYYGASVSMTDLARTAPGLTGLLSLLGDELLSWVEFWDAYCAAHPAGFAHDCPEPAAARVPAEPADYLDQLPPTDQVQQLSAAPCAPPTGTPAS